MACITVTDVNQNNGVIHAVHKVLMAQASSSSLARRPKGTAQAVPFLLAAAPAKVFRVQDVQVLQRMDPPEPSPAMG